MSNATELKTHDEYLAAVNQEGRVVVLFTSPSWCAPCRAFEPHWIRVQMEEHDIPLYVVRELLLDERLWAMEECGITTNPTAQLWENGEFVRNIKVPVGGLAFLADIRT